MEGVLDPVVAHAGAGQQERAAQGGQGEGDGDERVDAAGAQGDPSGAQAADGQHGGGADPGQAGALALQPLVPEFGRPRSARPPRRRPAPPRKVTGRSG
nr:hypothetical protein GCM10020093_038000 [Planobispora longispora]